MGIYHQHRTILDPVYSWSNRFNWNMYQHGYFDPIIEANSKIVMPYFGSLISTGFFLQPSNNMLGPLTRSTAPTTMRGTGKLGGGMQPEHNSGNESI